MIWALATMIIGAIVWVFVEGPNPPHKATQFARLGLVAFQVGLFWAVYLALAGTIHFGSLAR